MPKGSGRARGGSRARGGDHDELRLQQLLRRMRTALLLGMHPSPRKDEKWVWANTDAQVQGQAVRAIAAFVAAIPPRPFPVSQLQASIEDGVVALEYLLAVEQEAIYKQAAAVSAGLGKATNGRYMVRLLSPLAGLLASSITSEAAVSAATAMQSILVTLRSSNGTMGDDPIWKVLQESEALKHLLFRLDKSRAALEIGVVECGGVLATIMERWPVARYIVGKDEAVRSCLLDHCTSSNEAFVLASLRACQALGVAVLFLRDGNSLWKTLAHCLQQSKSLRVNRDALRLLSLVGRLPLFTASFKGPHIHAILEGCLRNINEGNRLRLTQAQRGVVLEAAHTTSIILRWAGEHHDIVLRLGIFKFASLQLTLGVRKHITDPKILEEDSSSDKLDVERKSREHGKVTSSLRSLLWEIVGCLAARFSSSTTEQMLSGVPTEGPGLGAITVFACTILVQALHRNNRVSHTDHYRQVNAYGSEEEQHISGPELLQICRTMFFLLSSTCADVAQPTKACMKTMMNFRSQTWLPDLVESLALGHTDPSVVKPESVPTATNLVALACFSFFPECRELLPQERTMEVLEAILKIYGERALAKTSTCSAKGSVVHQRAGIAAETCCEEIAEDWEGSDIVLIASLCAFTKLARGSERPRSVLPMGRLTDSEGFHGNTASLLWKLAECTTVAAGVRCWAASGLACFNIYGFPSRLGRDLCRILDESLFPDLLFLLKDGSRLLAHGVVLAVQCPSVLPKGLEHRLVVDSDVHEVQLSRIVSSRSFKALLEYAYSGVVHLEFAEVENMKVLSKRCGLESLTNLLHDRIPVWGLTPASCNLTPALESGGYPFADIILRRKLQADAVGEGTPCILEEGCREACTHVHGHRAILSLRSDYFRALFCSGMRESTAEAIDVDVPQQLLRTLLHYWYSGKLVRLPEATGWCAWNNLEADEQIHYLKSLIELAAFADRCLMTDLHEECNFVVLQQMEGANVHLGPAVITHAVKCARWDLVHMCAISLAPAYAQLRDTGALESLDEDLKDYLRAAHVQFISYLEAG